MVWLEAEIHLALRYYFKILKFLYRTPNQILLKHLNICWKIHSINCPSSLMPLSSQTCYSQFCCPPSILLLLSQSCCFPRASHLLPVSSSKPEGRGEQISFLLLSEFQESSIHLTNILCSSLSTVTGVKFCSRRPLPTTSSLKWHTVFDNICPLPSLSHKNKAFLNRRLTSTLLSVFIRS